MKKFILMPILWLLFLTPSWPQEMGLKVNKEFGNRRHSPWSSCAIRRY